MKFTKTTITTIVALVSSTAAATAPAVEAWNMGLSLYQPQTTSISHILERERMIAQRMFNIVGDVRGSYPSHHQQYELIDNNEKFELTVDVPGVKQENIDIKLDDEK